MATTGGFQSYTIGSDLGLTYSGNVTTSSDCPNANHIAVSDVSPYTVFAIAYSTACPTLAISVDENGTFESSWAEANYSDSESSVHGGWVSPDGAFLYSADGELFAFKLSNPFLVPRPSASADLWCHCCFRHRDADIELYVDPGNSVYVHSIDTTAGTVEQIQHLVAPTESDPRHLAVHPNGNWVYVLYEAASTVAVYSRDSTTGLLTDTNTTYSLLPDGK